MKPDSQEKIKGGWLYAFAVSTILWVIILILIL